MLIEMIYNTSTNLNQHDANEVNQSSPRNTDCETPEREPCQVGLIWKELDIVKMK